MSEEIERLAEREAVIERGLRHFFDVGQALKEIKDEELYKRSALRPDGFATFEDYCPARWGFSRRYADQLIFAAEFVGRLRTGTIVPVPIAETHVRPLSGLPQEEQSAAWEKAVETAPGGRVTQAHVASVVDAMKRREPETLPKALDTEAIRAASACREAAAGLAGLSTRLLPLDGEYLAVIMDDDLFQTYEHCFVRFVAQRERLLARRADSSVVRMKRAKEGLA